MFSRKYRILEVKNFEEDTEESEKTRTRYILQRKILFFWTNIWFGCPGYYQYVPEFQTLKEAETYITEQFNRRRYTISRVVKELDIKR